jgi:hypothetical protein
MESFSPVVMAATTFAARAAGFRACEEPGQPVAARAGAAAQRAQQSTAAPSAAPPALRLELGMRQT